MESTSALDIRSSCLSEHTALIECGGQVIERLKAAPSLIDSSWMEDQEFAECLVMQAYSLEAAASLAIGGFYREAYNTIRMAFEGYWLFRLIGTCYVVAEKWSVKRRASDRSLKSAKDRFVRGAKETLGRDFISVKMAEGSKLTITKRGNRIKDADGNLSKRMVSPYWHMWKRYRGGHFLAKRHLKTKRFLQGEWAIARRRQDSTFETYSRNLYRGYFAFDPLLAHLRLNKVLTKKTSTRVIVHYNFLSSFSHSNYESKYRLVRGRVFNQFEGLEYDHYHSELALLYVAHLGAMHLDLLALYSEKPETELRDAAPLIDLSARVHAALDYFWFIFNGPHQYDRFEYANRKSNYAKDVFITPAAVEDRHVRYYDDPYVRLRDLHSSNSELTSRNQYISPFPRRDAYP